MIKENEKIKIKFLKKKIKILNQEIKLTSVLILLFIIVFFVFGYIEESRITELKEKQKASQNKAFNGQLEKDWLVKDYQKQTAEILSSYFNRKNSEMVGSLKMNDPSQNQLSGWLDLVRETKNQLLALITPSVYKNLHLNLVLSFNLIEQGIIAQDDNKIDSGEEGLNNLIKNYPWLTE